MPTSAISCSTCCTVCSRVFFSCESAHRQPFSMRVRRAVGRRRALHACERTVRTEGGKHARRKVPIGRCGHQQRPHDVRLMLAGGQLPAEWAEVRAHLQQVLVGLEGLLEGGQALLAAGQALLDEVEAVDLHIERVLGLVRGRAGKLARLVLC